MKKLKIKKAVFPVAGMGTRFLPATKANPKEMLPVVDKPLIQYAVEEAIAAGITELIFVTSNSKRAIEDHFDSNYELEVKLETQQKYALLQTVRDILPANIRCSYVRQHDPLGLGHAIACAQHIVGEEAFVVLLADDLIDSGSANCLQEMITIYQQTSASVVAVQAVQAADVAKYGIVAVAEGWQGCGEIFDIVEKPEPASAPSKLAAVGRYLLTPGIFSSLAQVSAGKGGEIQLTDAIALLLAQEKVYGYQFPGIRYDCGNKMGYLKATIAYALKHPEIADQMKEYLSQFSTENEIIT